jgi:hypothetical protein
MTMKIYKRAMVKILARAMVRTKVLMRKNLARPLAKT